MWWKIDQHFLENNSWGDPLDPLEWPGINFVNHRLCTLKRDDNSNLMPNLSLGSFSDIPVGEAIKDA